MDKIRKGVADVAEEAEKAARIGRLRTEISGFNEEKKRLYQTIGEKIIQVYAAGGQTDPDFSAEWQRIQALDAEIVQREEEIEATKGDVAEEEAE